MRIPPRVAIVEVGPRDGLQNETSLVQTADKIAFVDQLSAAGHRIIEVSAFVSPKWVPQMGDAADVFAGIARRPGVRFTALVPNPAGLTRAMAAGVSEVAIFAAAVGVLDMAKHEIVVVPNGRHPLELIRRAAIRSLTLHFCKRATISGMGHDVTARTVCGIHINRRALGEFDCEVCFQLVQLLKNSLSNVGDAHLASDIYLHGMPARFNTKGDEIIFGI